MTGCIKYCNILDTMKSIKVKTAINELIKRLGSEEAVAARFGISKRWLIYLKTGQKKASYYLAQAIKRELDRT